MASHKRLRSSIHQLETLPEQGGSTSEVHDERRRSKFRNRTADLRPSPERKKPQPRPEFQAMRSIKYQKRLKEKLAREVCLPRKPEEILKDLNKALGKIQGVSEIRERAVKSNIVLSAKKQAAPLLPKIGKREVELGGSRHYGSVDNLRRDVSYFEKEPRYASRWQTGRLSV